MQCDAETALAATLKNPARKYPGREDPRCRDGRWLFPATPMMPLPRDGTVFTIGSCFARNVEEALVARGVDVPTARFRAPPEEAPGRPNRVLNQYNPATMLQCVTHAGDPLGERALYGDRGGVVDALLSTGGRAVGAVRAAERRAEIAALYADGLDAAETVIVTLGLVETWHDAQDGLFLNEMPPRRVMAAHPGRFTFRRLGVEECRAMVFELMTRLLEGRRRQVILTVSPVPLQVTFAGGDAVTANAQSKAVLRCVAGLAADAFDGVVYFPSYEMVSSGGLASFGEDNVHVRPAVVERVVADLLAGWEAPHAAALQDCAG